MVKPKQFSITLNNPQGVYFGGQAVDGVVTVDLEEPLTTRGLKLLFKGKATVRWTETHSNGKTTYTVTYWNNETYFDFTQELYGKSVPGWDGKEELPAGLHTFPFSGKLPESLPSSFEGQAGNVRYMVKAVIDRKFRFDYSTKCVFTVLGHLDLNTLPDAVLPLDSSKDKFLCCLCCKTGPISARLHIARKGVVPGEAVIVSAEIENLSSRVMAKTTIKLKQKNHFHATTKTRVESTKLVELQHPEIRPGKSDIWNNERLVVPPVPPSGLVGCRIIDIQYILQLNVDPKGLGFDLKVPLEITVGTVPLRQAVQQYPALLPPPAGTPTAETLYSNSGGAGALSTLDPALPPPCYSESFFGKTNVKKESDEEADISYAPSYTYYNWGFETTSTTSPSK